MSNSRKEGAVRFALRSDSGWGREAHRLFNYGVALFLIVLATVVSAEAATEVPECPYTISQDTIKDIENLKLIPFQNCTPESTEYPEWVPNSSDSFACSHTQMSQSSRAIPLIKESERMDKSCLCMFLVEVTLQATVANRTLGATHPCSGIGDIVSVTGWDTEIVSQSDDSANGTVTITKTGRCILWSFDSFQIDWTEYGEVDPIVWTKKRRN